MSDSHGLKLALHKIALLFRRDLAVARTYRVAFAFEIFQALLGAASFYFLSRFVASPSQLTILLLTSFYAGDCLQEHRTIPGFRRLSIGFVSPTTLRGGICSNYI